MKTFLTLALIQLIMIPLFSVSADDHVPGDDLIEILIPYGGDYTLTCYADGYRPEGKPVRVQGSIVEIDIHMEEPRIPLIYQFLYLILELLGSIG